MGEYHITGGRRLSGRLSISGGKNAILPILASVVLNGDISVIRNCPHISDTFAAIDILRAIGCEVTFENDVITVNSKDAVNWNVPEEYVHAMRSSIIFLGGVLGRFGEVKIGYPGGCELGRRPIDLHLKGIKELGAQVTEEAGYVICKAKKLKGARVDLTFPSVGATENIMIAAVLADGQTIISNAAKEPEIVDLQNFLKSMGADVKGAGGDTVIINGVDKLNKAEYTVMPDRIVAGTYLTAAAITGGSITLLNICPEHIYPITARLKEAGCIIKTEGQTLTLEAPSRISAIEELRTQPHPGFPTDMQPQLVALLSVADGTSVIHETVFESRNKHISELARMGANIVLSTDGMTIVIKGVKELKGTTVTSRDLRGGAALILAGLTAKGKTIVTGSEYVERGYVKIENDLRQLGADIEFIQSSKSGRL